MTFLPPSNEGIIQHMVRNELRPPLLIIVLFALPALSGCSLGGQGEISNVQSSGSEVGTPTPYVYDIKDDLQYIDMMVPHHQLAVDMAKIAVERAQRGQLEGLGRDILLSQQDEIRRMLIWQAELSAGTTPVPWHIGGTGATSGHDHMQMPGMNVDLAELAGSQNFDRDFIDAMIPHHQSAIDMSRAALPYLKRKEVHDLAQDIITVQQIEIERMQGWLEAWY
jgi:uncharacterized protein (DUF305 family)